MASNIPNVQHYFYQITEMDWYVSQCYYDEVVQNQPYNLLNVSICSVIQLKFYSYSPFNGGRCHKTALQKSESRSTCIWVSSYISIPTHMFVHFPNFNPNQHPCKFALISLARINHITEDRNRHLTSILLLIHILVITFSTEL